MKKSSPRWRGVEVQEAPQKYNPKAWQKISDTFTNNWGSDGSKLDFRQNVINWTLEANPKKLLEVGCFKGHYLHELRTAGWEGEYVGVDITPAFVEHCKKRFPEEHFEIADARALPFQTDEFEMVMCAGVLMHLDKPWAALREAERTANQKVLFSVYGSMGETFTTHGKGFLNTWFNRRDFEKHIKGKILNFASFKRSPKKYVFQWVVEPRQQTP